MMNYLKAIAAKSVIGIDTPHDHERIGAHSKRFFYAQKPVYGGPYKGSSERRPLVSGSINLVRPATYFRLIPVGGGSLTHHEELHHA